jgi:hypothetical protein
VLRLALVVLWMAVSPTPSAAQAAAGDPLATLRSWADGVWIALLDRDGAWAGRLSDQGILQRFNPDQDGEYPIDVETALFSPSEDARWAARPEGLRVAVGSINHPHIMQSAEWRERYQVSAGWSVEGRYLREHSLSAVRDHIRPGLFWRPAGTSAWEVGATLGLHFFKPSADVELVAGRTWSGPRGRRGQVEVRVGLLDAFNDLIFNGLGVSPEDAVAHFDYLAQPVALRADGTWSLDRVRLELRGGVSRRASVRVTFPASGEPPYELSERIAFAGGLVEVHAGSRTTVAAHGTLVRAATERLADAPSPSDLRLRELTRAVGLSLRQRALESLSVEADFHWIERPETRESGWRTGAGNPLPGPLIDHRDRELLGRVGLVRRPPDGWTGRLFYADLDRETDPLLPHLTGRNQRLVVEGGYLFATGFEVTAGLRWDVDAWREKAFDGGQLRFTTGAP